MWCEKSPSRLDDNRSEADVGDEDKGAGKDEAMEIVTGLVGVLSLAVVLYLFSVLLKGGDE